MRRREPIHSIALSCGGRDMLYGEHTATSDAGRKANGSHPVKSAQACLNGSKSTPAHKVTISEIAYSVAEIHRAMDVINEDDCNLDHVKSEETESGRKAKAIDREPYERISHLEYESM